MRKLLLGILLVFFVSDEKSYSQSTAKIYLTTSYNFFEMQDLKKMQNEIMVSLNTQNIPAKITENYVPFLGMEAGFCVPITSESEEGPFVGGFFNFTSTGGRVHYQDYSGEVKNDQIAACYSFGGLIGFEKKLFESIFLEYSVSIQLIQSSFENLSSLRLGNESQTTDLNFTSVSAGIEPRLAPFVDVFGLNIGISLSYLIYFPSKLEYDRYEDAYLIYSNGENILIDWSGVRFGLKLRYPF